jgi:hypothetical protein
LVPLQADAGRGVLPKWITEMIHKIVDKITYAMAVVLFSILLFLILKLK